MLKIIPKLFIIIFSSLLFPKEYLAIIDFSANNVSNGDVNALTQRLITEMINLGEYQVIERSEMKKILDEQKFQHSGCVTAQCAVDIGKLLGAKYMVVGSISKVGSTYSADARIIDVESGEANKSATYSFKGEIDRLLEEGMLEVAKQLSIENYTPTRTQINNTSSKTTEYNYSNKPKKKKRKNNLFDYFALGTQDLFNPYHNEDEEFNFNDITYISIFHFRRKNIQFKFANHFIHGYNTYMGSLPSNGVTSVPYIGLFKNVKKYNMASVSANIWVSLSGNVAFSDNQFENYSWYEYPPSEMCDATIIEISGQIETAKLLSFGTKLETGYRFGFDGDCNCFPENNEFFARLEIILLSFGKNY